MDPIKKAMWTAALRSGKYPQTKNKLHTDDGFCCLGVKCDLAVREGVISEGRNHIGIYEYGEFGASAVLPVEVMKWSGIEDENPVVYVRPREGAVAAYYGLAELNDEYDWTFEQIADVIDEQLQTFGS